jgi:hypothetical protein
MSLARKKGKEAVKKKVSAYNHEISRVETQLTRTTRCVGILCHSFHSCVCLFFFRWRFMCPEKSKKKLAYLNLKVSEKKTKLMLNRLERNLSRSVLVYQKFTFKFKRNNKKKIEKGIDFNSIAIIIIMCAYSAL